MSSWLDTETKALLQKLPPEKLSPSDTASFTLVLLSIYGRDNARVLRAITKIPGHPQNAAHGVLARALPLAVKSGVSHGDALLGQFELISADAISVFVKDEVVETASQEYLRQLYAQLLQSSEFELVSLRIESIPGTDLGQHFVEQFLGNDNSWRSQVLRVARKKARIMAHWAQEIGGRVTCPDI